MKNNKEMAFNDANLGQSWINYWINQLEETKSNKKTELDFNLSAERTIMRDVQSISENIKSKLWN